MFNSETNVQIFPKILIIVSFTIFASLGWDLAETALADIVSHELTAFKLQELQECVNVHLMPERVLVEISGLQDALIARKLLSLYFDKNE